MWTRLYTWWKRLWAQPKYLEPTSPDDRGAKYRVVFFEVRGEAQSAARVPHIVAVFNTAGTPKWAYLMCPCGCGQQVALNLMVSHRPVWRVLIRTDTDFSIFPSVDSTTCGAHFWLRAGRITWAE